MHSERPLNLLGERDMSGLTSHVQLMFGMSTTGLRRIRVGQRGLVASVPVGTLLVMEQTTRSGESVMFASGRTCTCAVIARRTTETERLKKRHC